VAKPMAETTAITEPSFAFRFFAEEAQAGL
jgi:hypothetical protein